MSDRPGFFARLRNIFSATPEIQSPVSGQATKALASVNPGGEIGVDGIAIWGGQIIAESNQKLLFESAYGRAGTRIWGEWEKFRRTDESVAKALNFVMGPIRSARVDLVVPDKALNPFGQDQADFIRHVIDNVDPGWPDLLTQTTEMALSTGFAIHEEVWGPFEFPTLPGGKGVGITKFAERLPSSIHYNGWLTNKQTGELEAVRQNAPGHDLTWVQPEIPAEKLLLNTWNRNGNNFQGYSVFRAVYYPLMIRRELARIMAIGHMRESLGIPIAYAEKDAKPLTTAQRDSLAEFMQNCVAHENANIIMPQGWKLDWLFSKSADKGHIITTYNELGLFVLEQLGAQQMFLGTGGTGSRSVGEVHAAAATATIEMICAHLCACFNGVGARPYTGFVRKLTDLNWGPQQAYVTMRLTPRKPQLKVLDRMNAIKVAKDAGLITVTIEDENAARESLELEPIDEATREGEKSAALERARAMMPAPGTEEDPKKPGEFPPKKFAMEAMRRPLRPSERVLDLASIAAVFDNGRADFEQRLRPVIAKLIVKAIPDVKEAMKDGDPSEVATMPLEVTELTAAVAAWMEEVRAKGYASAQGERGRGGLKLADPKPSAMANRTATALQRQLLRRMENRIRGQLESSAVDVIRTGGEPEEVVSRVMQRQLDDGTLKTEAGSVLGKTFAMGREEFAEEQGDIESVELSAALDAATCSPCWRLDGTEFDFNSPEHLEHIPPMSNICDGGDNCRCVLIYNFKR